MILSNAEIQEALDAGFITISPEPEPRGHTEGAECPYQTTAVDLRLDKHITRIKDDLGITMDLTRGSFARLMKCAGIYLELNDEQPFHLAPGRLAIGRTVETISLPLPSPDAGQPCFAARIEGRSSLARCGLLVHFTAPTIHAGYNGRITLEMYNLGAYPITLKAGDYVCQLIIEQVIGTPFRNDSQFQEAEAAQPTAT